MKICEISKELGVSNKDLLTYLKSKGLNYKSHMQTVDDEAYDLLMEKFKASDSEQKNVVSVDKKTVEPKRQLRKFEADDLISCRSAVPFKLNALSADKMHVYHWEYFGDTEQVPYKDLMALRRTEYISKPLIIIEDPDLCVQWKRELGDVYKWFEGIEYPEDFFDRTDEEFKQLLNDAPIFVKEVIKTTAIAMIHAENYPSVQKVKIIDEVLDTCIIDFLS